MDQVKKWGDYSQAEQEERLKAIGQAIKDNGLAGIVKVKIMQEVVFKLSANGQSQNDETLLLEGEVAAEKGENVKNLSKALKEGGLKNVHPETVQFEIEVKPSVGGPYIPIKEVVDIKDQHEQSIEHKPGQVFLIDFWATWCPPCQAPMAHNQKLLEQNGERWGDKVRIIGISIDKTVEAVVKHV
jgi:thiol-disulfide isomerase/thioredoxin